MILCTLELAEENRRMIENEVPDKPVVHRRLHQLSEEELAEVEVLLTYGYDLEGFDMSRLSALRWIHVGQSGMDPIPFEALREKGILLTNSRGINSVTIAEFVLGMMLNVVRNTFVFYGAAQRGEWDRDTHLDELYGKTLGIMGLGAVGREIAKRAKAFDMKVLGADIVNAPVPFVDEVFLSQNRMEMIPRCDFLVLCMPLTADTRYIADAAELAAMKPGSWLVNVGRGPLVNTEALRAALDAGRPAGAILDVFETEPLPPNDDLWRRDNVFITPHIAGDRQASYTPRMMRILCDNLAAWPHAERLVNRINVENGF